MVRTSSTSNDKRTRLPSKLSGLIRVAVADMTEIEALNLAAQSKGKVAPYMFDMNTWHRPRRLQGGTQCSVCMAGSVLAMSVEVPRVRNSSPVQSLPNRSDQYKMYALNNVRQFEIEDAIKCMLPDGYLSKHGSVARKVRALDRQARRKWSAILEKALPAAYPDMPIDILNKRIYDAEVRNLFKIAMLDVADMLEKAGF